LDFYVGFSMIASMTGYGVGISQKDETVVTVEVRSVNHRFLDLHVRLTREFSSLETEIQQLVRNYFARGRVDVNVSIQGGSPVEAMVNASAVKGYLESAAKLKDEFRLEDSLDLKTLMTLPGVLQSRDSLAAAAAGGEIPGMVRESVRNALESVVAMRRQEGEALESDMLRHLDSIRRHAREIGGLSPASVVEYRRKLEERLAQLLQVELDPQRLAQEVALMADKCDISEEIARLESHLDQYASLMQTGTEVGKKLDFLLQEMQREANTILSKAANLEITRHGIAVRADIEKLREQIQNVE